MPGLAHHVPLPEAVAPFGGADVMVADLKQRVFPTRDISFVAIGTDGRRDVRRI